jgi:tocopherol cyclase
MRLRMWELDRNGGVRKGDPFVDASSSSAALEVGGGPWWGPWKEESQVNPAVAAAVNAPLDAAVSRLEDLIPFEIPSLLKPPGY